MGAIFSLFLNFFQASPTSAVSASFTIAFQGPLSGPEGVVGKDQLDAVKFAVYHFNQHFNGKFEVKINLIMI